MHTVALHHSVAGSADAPPLLLANSLLYVGLYAGMPVANRSFALVQRALVQAGALPKPADPAR
jgi:hypothetical protein